MRPDAAGLQLHARTLEWPREALRQVVRGELSPTRAAPGRGDFYERLDAAEVFLTSDGRKPNCSRKRLLKWDELLNPIEYAISVIVFVSCCSEVSRS